MDAEDAPWWYGCRCAAFDTWYAWVIRDVPKVSESEWWWHLCRAFAAAEKCADSEWE